MPFFSIITIPSATAVLDGVGTSSSPVFTEFLPVALFGVGFIIGGLIVYALISWLIGGVSNVIGGNRDAYDEYIHRYGKPPY